MYCLIQVAFERQERDTEDATEGETERETEGEDRLQIECAKWPLLDRTNISNIGKRGQMLRNLF